jgi:CO/xanthine dehydrogenase FAD-binding subunit
MTVGARLTFCTVGAMPMLLPTSLAEATSMLADHPGALILAGGTDVMVEINDGHRRPDGVVVAVGRVPELRSWRHDPSSGTLTLGASVTYRELCEEPLVSLAPALAEAARTVGSPQIRNAGTLAGNLATCSPAGDGLPVLAAFDADVTLASSRGIRTIPVREFMVGVKRTAIEPGEMIVEITLPIVTDGWQGYAKVGVRNAMVIAVASACLVVDRVRSRVAIALGSVGPTIVRCDDAEAWLADQIDWSTMRAETDAIDRFGSLVAAASRPITDHRSTAEYRRHAVGVLARRLARRATTTEPAAGERTGAR